MKKFITSFAIAASMLCGTASAQVPTTYNYQGVSSVQNQPIKVEFAIMDGDNVVYREEQTVQTNKDGLFTTKVGGNADGWDEIDWTAGKYELHVKAQGHEATCELNAVPYATVAASYVGQDIVESDLQELVTANMARKTETEANKAEIAKTNNWLENVDMIATPTYKQVFGWEGETEEENVVGLVEKVANLEMVTDDIAGIQETLRGKANVDEVAAIENLAQSLSEDLYKEEGIVDAVIANQEAIAALQEGAAVDEKAIAELQTLAHTTSKTLQNHLTEALNTNNANAEKFAAIDEVLDIVTSDVQGLAEKSRGYATVDELAPVLENIEMMTPVLQKMEEDIEANSGAIAIVSDDLQGLMEKSRSFATVEEVAPIENLAQSLSEDLYKENGIVETLIAQGEKLGDVANIAENAYMGAEQAHKAVFGDDDTDGLVAQMEIVSSDVQGIAESLRGKATVEVVAELQEQVNTNEELLNVNVKAVNSIDAQMQKLGNEVAGLQNAVITKGDKTAVDANTEAISILSDDVQGLQEKMRGVATVTEVEAFKADVANAMENVEMLGNYVMGEEEGSVTSQLETLNSQMQILFSEDDGPVAAVTTGLTQLSNVVTDQGKAITNLQQSVDLLYSEDDGPVAAVTSGLTQLSNVVTDQATEIDGIKSTLAAVKEVADAAPTAAALKALNDKLEQLDAKIHSLETTLTNHILGAQQ